MAVAEPLTIRLFRIVTTDKRHPPPRTTGVIVVCGQKIALGRAGQTLAIAVSGTTLAIKLDDAETTF